MGIYVKSGLVEMFKKYVYVEYDSEAPKRRSPNIGERRAKFKKKTHFLTLTKFGLMRSSKITVFQIGDLQNMLYFPGASHISPMETFTLAD